MEFKKMVAPFEASEVLIQLEQIFGVEERLLEECQFNGSEAEFNRDIVYLAYEKDTLLGMIHATIPKRSPYLAGLSAMFTTEAARGKGIGKVLFAKIVEEVSACGARLTVLGTDNPVAAKLYSKFGFGFCPGSNVMARFSEGNMVDFVRDYYRTKKGSAEVLPGDPSMRIPMIPLVLQRDFGLILDINTEIFNSSTITERSCMGLFPRYEALRKRGGDYFMAFDTSGTLGAVCSVAPQDNGSFRGDFFALPSFASAIPDMLKRMETGFGHLFFEVSVSDRMKKTVLSENGFHAVGEGCCKSSDIIIPTVQYAR